jgi:hypothetical protein
MIINSQFSFCTKYEFHLYKITWAGNPKTFDLVCTINNPEIVPPVPIAQQM